MSRAIRTILATLLAITCLGASLAAAAPLWTFGIGRMQWFVRSVPPAGDAPARWTVAVRDGARVAEIASLGRAPAQFASFGDRLAILSVDGGWSLASRDGVVVAPTLPNGRSALAIASGRGLLWFLTEQGDGRALSTWDGHSFADAGAAPDGGPLAVSARLLVTRSNLYIAYRSPDGVRIVANDGGQWRPAGAPIVAEAAWIVQDERRGPMLIARNAAAWTIRPIARDGSLGDVATLAASSLAAASNASATIVDGDVRIAWSDGEQVVEQAFDSSNRPIGSPTRARPIAAVNADAPSTFDRTASWIGMLAMVVLVLTASRARGESDPREKSSAPGPPAPATLARRLAAGLVDAWPLYLACAYVVLTSDRADEEVLRLDATRDRLIVLVGALAYAILAMACEWRWQRTLGKLLFGLRVVDVDGARPTVRAIAIRNVLRLLDLNLVTLLIVPLSRQRQRLGDLVAGTLVVHATEDAAPAAADPADGADSKR